MGENQPQISTDNHKIQRKPYYVIAVNVMNKLHLLWSNFKFPIYLLQDLDLLLSISLCDLNISEVATEITLYFHYSYAVDILIVPNYAEGVFTVVAWSW